MRLHTRGVGDVFKSSSYKWCNIAFDFHHRVAASCTEVQIFKQCSRKAGNVQGDVPRWERGWSFCKHAGSPGRAQGWQCSRGRPAPRRTRRTALETSGLLAGSGPARWFRWVCSQGYYTDTATACGDTGGSTQCPVCPRWRAVRGQHTWMGSQSGPVSLRWLSLCTGRWYWRCHGNPRSWQRQIWRRSTVGAQWGCFMVD